MLNSCKSRWSSLTRLKWRRQFRVEVNLRTIWESNQRNILELMTNIWQRDGTNGEMVRREAGGRLMWSIPDQMAIMTFSAKLESSSAFYIIGLPDRDNFCWLRGYINNLDSSPVITGDCKSYWTAWGHPWETLSITTWSFLPHETLRVSGTQRQSKKREWAASFWR